jgi:lathosterol oxidase
MHFKGDRNMDLLLFGTALMLLIAVERMPRLQLHASPFFRPFFVSDFWYLATGAVLLSVVMRTQALPWAGIFSESIRQTLADAPLMLTGGMALVLHDLGAYLSHIMLHRFTLLWEFHKVHHSSRALDWLATFRAHLCEHALRHLLSPVLLILLGFPLIAVGMASAVTGVWAALVHANLGGSWRWLEPVLISPRLHRLHHVPATSTRNFGVFLSVWDRLGGTLATDPTAALQPLGVPGAVERYPQTWPQQFVEPFRYFIAERMERAAI